MTSFGSGSFPRYMRAISVPSRPKIAPEAPADIRTGLHQRLAILPDNPEMKYAAKKVQRPSKRSVGKPSTHKDHIFTSRWTIPMCRNVAVTIRQGCVPRVSGPKLAPHCSIWSVVGAVRDTPRATMMRNTTTFMAMSAMVADGGEAVR